MMLNTPGGVRFELVDTVGHIILDRAEVANAVDLPTAEAFGDAVDRAASEPVRAVVLRGEGSRFCAGGDITSIAAASDPTHHLSELATQMDEPLRLLARLPKPVVTAVHGVVAGAGLGVMLAADLVIAERSTRFVMAYGSVGLTPDCGVSYLLPRAIGTQRALELALTGRSLTSEEARDWGLATEVVDDGTAHERASRLAARLAAGPAKAAGETRKLMRTSWETSREHSASDEVRTIAAMVTTSDAKALIARFTGGRG